MSKVASSSVGYNFAVGISKPTYSYQSFWKKCLRLFNNWMHFRSTSVISIFKNNCSDVNLWRDESFLTRKLFQKTPSPQVLMLPFLEWCWWATPRLLRQLSLLGDDIYLTDSYIKPYKFTPLTKPWLNPNRLKTCNCWMHSFPAQKSFLYLE